MDLLAEANELVRAGTDDGTTVRMLGRIAIDTKQ